MASVHWNTRGTSPFLSVYPVAKDMDPHYTTARPWLDPLTPAKTLHYPAIYKHQLLTILVHRKEWYEAISITSNFEIYQHLALLLLHFVIHNPEHYNKNMQISYQRNPFKFNSTKSCHFQFSSTLPLFLKNKMNPNSLKLAQITLFQLHLICNQSNFQHSTSIPKEQDEP